MSCFVLRGVIIHTRSTKVVYDLNHALANDDSATIAIGLSEFDLRKLARCSHYVSGDYGHCTVVSLSSSTLRTCWN